MGFGFCDAGVPGQCFIAITEIEQPSLQKSRFYSIGELREINIAASLYGIACVIWPLVIMAATESVVNPAAWPALLGFLGRAGDDLVWGNFAGFEAGDEDERLYDRTRWVLIIYSSIYKRFIRVGGKAAVIVSGAVEVEGRH